MDNDGPSIEDTMAETLSNIESGERDNGQDSSQGEASAAPTPQNGQPHTQNGMGAAPEPWQQMPKAWRKEMGEYWTKQDPRVQQYIHEREQQVEQGIRKYQGTVDQWNRTMQPYDRYIKQYGLNPHDITSNLLAAHTILKFGTPEQKAQVAAIMDRDYGLRQFYGQNGQVAPPPTEALVGPLNNRLAAIEAQFQQRALADASNEVEAFIADPANELATDAAPRMLAMLESGKAATLREAYEMATWTDPTLRERLIASRVSAAARPSGRPPVNVRPSASRAPSPQGERGTIEDTMREQLRQINSR
jgi:hypothetical protein